MSATAAAIQLANGRPMGGVDHSADMPKSAGKRYRAPQQTERQWLADNIDAFVRPCGVAFDAFRLSQPLTMTFGVADAEQPAAEMIALPREFSTGSLGYNFSGKVMLEVCGRMVAVQVSGNVTLINSKQAVSK